MHKPHALKKESIAQNIAQIIQKFTYEKCVKKLHSGIFDMFQL